MAQQIIKKNLVDLNKFLNGKDWEKLTNQEQLDICKKILPLLFPNNQNDTKTNKIIDKIPETNFQTFMMNFSCLFNNHMIFQTIYCAVNVISSESAIVS